MPEQTKLKPELPSEGECSQLCIKCGESFTDSNPVCCDQGTGLEGSINGVCVKCCDGKIHGTFDDYADPPSELERLAREVDSAWVEEIQSRLRLYMHLENPALVKTLDALAAHFAEQDKGDNRCR